MMQAAQQLTSNQTGRYRELKGENGSLFISQSLVGSRMADTTLSVLSAKGEGPWEGVIARTALGGGHNSIIQPILNRALNASEAETSTQSSQPVSRPPVYILSDDEGCLGGINYIELHSDSKGFVVQAHDTANPHSSGPIRFTSPEATKILTEIYQAAKKLQPSLKKSLSTGLKSGRGHLAAALSQEEWEQAQFFLDQICEKAHKAEQEEIPFGQIKRTGILLIKLGIPLPKAIQKRWREHFAHDHEVQAAQHQHIIHR